MNQDIIFKGVTSTPSDHDCPDGEMAESVNMIYEDGAVRPIAKPTALFNLQPGEELLVVHKTASYCHYILRNANNQALWIDQASLSTRRILSNTPLPTVKHVSTIGNTIVFLCSDGLHYFLWGNQSGVTRYISISSDMPEISLSFGLTGSIVQRSGYSTAQYVSVGQGGANNDMPDFRSSDDQAKFSDAVMAKVSSLIADEVTKKGRFCMPFFVRYALRMFDGSLTHHSAPILMLPSSKGEPLVLTSASRVNRNVDESFWQSIGFASGSGDTYTSFDVFAPACSLDVQLFRTQGSLTEYSDLIRSVDIFVSAPIYNYNPDGKCDGFSPVVPDNFGVFAFDDSIDSAYSGNTTVLNLLKKHSKRNMVKAVKTQYGFTDSVIAASVNLPRKGEGLADESISSCSNFYLVKSIPIDQLPTERTVLDLESLENLVTRQVMTDDYDSHCRLFADYSFVYNSRLMLCGIQKELFDGYFSTQFIDANLVNYIFETPPSTGGDSIVPTSGLYVASVSDHSSSRLRVDSVVTYIKRDGNVMRVVERPGQYSMAGAIQSKIMLSGGASSNSINVPYFYHPDPYAFKAVVYCSIGLQRYAIELPLANHDFLNGSYYYDNMAGQTPVAVASEESQTSNNIVSAANKIYVSEIENPFFFPGKSIVPVGSGTVIGMGAAAKTMSPGQFGSHPLYAFATDGVWALSVSDTGTYSAVLPIEPDVCTSPESITQVDGAVLFASGRGIMAVSGSEVRCVSETLNGMAYHRDALPCATSLCASIGLSGDSDQSDSFADFAKGCRMMYDYMHQRVYLFNPESNIDGSQRYPYCYVFSNKSGAWSMYASGITHAVLSYPGSLAVMTDRSVVSFDGDTASKVSGILSTRPIKITSPGMLKEVTGVLHRGAFGSGAVCFALYGSRNLTNWHLIGSTKSSFLCNIHGTPWKYFRILAVATLAPNDSLTGASFDFEIRREGKLL